MEFSLFTNNEIRLELARRLREQRLAKNIQVTDLAARAGISTPTLKRFEASGDCTFESFVRLVMALGLATELAGLFVIKAKTIAELEQTAKKVRRRASRKMIKGNQP